MMRHVLTSRLLCGQTRRQSGLVMAAFAAAALGSVIRPAAAQCFNPSWSTQFSTPATGLPYLTTSLVVFDPDGPGPLPAELYVAGMFASAGSVPGTRGIARWNGNSWASVGGGLSGSSMIGTVGVFDPDGTGPALPVLVAVGSFVSIGGIAAQHAAYWDGFTWTPMGNEITYAYLGYGMTEFDPDGPGPQPRTLVVSAQLELNGQPAGPVQWDGTSWSAMPITDSAFAMAVFDEDGPGPANPALFYGVDSSPGLMKWDGVQSQPVGGGLTRSGLHMCCALRVVDEDGPGPNQPVLLVGGNFTLAGGQPAKAIARWNGSQWSPMGEGIGGGFAQVEDIIAVDYTGGAGAPTIYAFGLGATAEGSGLMRWQPANQQWSISGEVATQGIGLPHRIAAFLGSDSTPSVYLTGPISAVNQVPAVSFARMFCDCAANCDHSAANPTLTANDFQCFLNKFAAADPYANCDGSTAIPVLTANDFQCFLTVFAVGCS